MTTESFSKSSPEYDFWLPYWQRCRDCITGTPAIKSPDKRENYLRPLEGHKDNPAEYDAYVKDSPFYNATKRTAQAYAGLVLRKSPAIELPDIMREMGYVDIILSMLKWGLNEVIAVNRAGLFVDYQAESGMMTVAEAQQSRALPDVSYFPAETIIRADEIQINSALSVTRRVILSYITTEQDSADEFKDVCVHNIKVLDLNDEGYYRQRHWTNEGDNWNGGDEIYPLMNGERMRFIPFQVLDEETNTPEIKEPPLLDIVELNLIMCYRPVWPMASF